MYETIKNYFASRRELYERMVADEILIAQVAKVAELLITTLTYGKKVLIFGNGGSAAEAQHFAAELVCQFERARRALPVIALTTDTSIITAYGNDLGFDQIFSRQIEALAQEHDVVIGMTTSDAQEQATHSQNILKGFKAARTKGAKAIGFFSAKTFNLLNYVDIPLIIPATSTALIQEGQLTLIHLLSKLIEDSLT